jgi:hypothetical protein
MVDRVELSGVRIFADSTRGREGVLRCEHGAPRRPHHTGVELATSSRAARTTYPGLPVPVITPYMTRSQSREHYAEGIPCRDHDRAVHDGNTGTYLDSPFHPTRRHDLAG